MIEIECEYKISTTFNDEVEIEVKAKEYKGVRFVIEYKMTNKNTGDVVLTGISKHCFINKENKPIRLKSEFPEIDAKLRALTTKGCPRCQSEGVHAAKKEEDYEYFKTTKNTFK